MYFLRLSAAFVVAAFDDVLLNYHGNITKKIAGVCQSL